MSIMIRSILAALLLALASAAYAETVTYQYNDPQGRLTEIVYSNGTTITYTPYDKASNRQDETVSCSSGTC
jgi:YD repeat-containing protein